MDRQHPAVAGCQGPPSPLDLDGTCLMAQLRDCLRNVEHPISGKGQKSTVRIDRNRPAEGNVAVRYERTTLPLLAKPKVLECDQHANTERVVDLSQVHILRTPPSHVVSPLRGWSEAKRSQVGCLKRIVEVTVLRRGRYADPGAPRRRRVIICPGHNDRASRVRNQRTISGDER